MEPTTTDVEHEGTEPTADGEGPRSTPRATRSGMKAHDMARLGKLGYLTSRLWFLALVAVVIFLGPIAGAMTREVPDPLPVHGKLADFGMTDQRSQPFGSKQLEGKIWVADFMFTTCPSICVRLSQRMKHIQHRTRHIAGGFHLVSFSVDPETDTPPKLAAYAKRFGASANRWSFLTGDLAAIEKTVVHGFKLAMGRDAEGFDQVFHSEKLVLVDRQGRIRGYYDATDAGIEKLIRDIGLVVHLG